MLPPTIPGKPFVGSLLQMRADPIDMFMRASRLGDVVHMHFPGKDAVLVHRPDDIKTVLIDEHRSFGKSTRGYNALRVGLGQGLITSEGSFWRRQRRIAQPAFHKRRVAGFADKMIRATVDMLQRWEQRCSANAIVDIDTEMMALTLRIVGECLLSSDLTDTTDSIGSAVTTLLDGVMDRITNPIPLPLKIPIPSNRRMRRALDNLDEVVLQVIADRRQQQGEHNDLLDMLLTATDEETGERMTDRQLRDEVITIVVAGHETTSNALTWSFYLMSRFPAVLEPLTAELDEVLCGRLPSVDDLPRLPYTAAIINEAMRLFPPVWLVARSVDRPARIGGYDIPEGWVVFICPYVTHRDAHHWPNPEGFRPERFLADGPSKRHNQAFIPFITGPRKCVGDAFAMMEAQLILATVMSRFVPELVAGHPVEPKPTITLRPAHGLKVTLRRRAEPASA